MKFEKKTITITIEEYERLKKESRELKILKNYQRIHELDFLVRQIYKYSNLITLDIRNIIEKYIEYDDKIEFTCKDCKQLLLINDIIKYKYHTHSKVDEAGQPKFTCDKCLILKSTIRIRKYIRGIEIIKNN
jgi:hypothetical protein